MTHMVEHRPMEQASDLPNWAVDSRGLAASVRCYSERAATRVAQALDLLERSEQIREQIVSDPDLTGEGWSKPMRVRAIPIDEKEIMQRAREAAIAGSGVPGCTTVDIRNGRADGSSAVLAAACALRDLAKPLADLVPPVDPDLIEARKIAVESQGKAIVSPSLDRNILEGRNDDSPLVQTALAAIKRGRELAGG